MSDKPHRLNEPERIAATRLFNFLMTISQRHESYGFSEMVWLLDRRRFPNNPVCAGIFEELENYKSIVPGLPSDYKLLVSRISQLDRVLTLHVHSEPDYQMLCAEIFRKRSKE